MAEICPYFMKDINPHIHEAPQIPSRTNSRRATLRHIIIKLPIEKDRES